MTGTSWSQSGSRRSSQRLPLSLSRSVNFKLNLCCPSIEMDQGVEAAALAQPFQLVRGIIQRALTANRPSPGVPPLFVAAREKTLQHDCGMGNEEQKAASRR